MDKPQGARPIPPDKRHAAYESIFGRPGATHHQHVISPNHYSQYISLPPQSGPSYPYSPQGPPVGNPDRLSHQSSLSAGYAQYPSQFQSGPSRQQFYPSAGPPASLNPHTSYPPYAPQYQGGYAGGYNPPSNPAGARARSMNNNFDTPGSQHAGLNESPNSIASGSFSAFTPPQGYQPLSYADRSPSHPSGPRDFYPTHQPSTHRQNDRSSQVSLPDVPPKIGVSLEHDDGKLDLDFPGAESELEIDGGSSELPWARIDCSSSNGQKTGSHHMREPSALGPALHVDTAAAASSLPTFPTSSPESTADHSAASTTLVGHGDITYRHSIEPARTVGRIPSRRDRIGQDRTMSMSSASSAFRPLLEQTKKGGKAGLTLDAGRASPTSIRQPARRAPVVYPAMLSRIAQAFRERMAVSDRVKDGLTYTGAFDGREAVDKIASIIKTTDRNLALLLGRALDAQKFFHDVTYDHRLRDNPTELYQFRTRLPDSYMTGELADLGIADADMKLNGQDDNAPFLSPATPASRPENADEAPLPSGVFTLLTDCYSPTCSRDQLCYSIACPRRLEQQARLNLKLQPGLSKQISKESLNDVVDDGTLWIHSVPQEIVNSVSEQEKRRQEAINEVIYTERDFVRDMEYLRDVWINRLKTEDVIPPDRRTDFLAQVFWNVHDIITVNTRLRDALNKRQKSYAVVDRIGDILLEAVPDFGPFVSYGAHQLYGKYEFEKEKSSNPAFAQFVETTERLPESRKLELNAYLTKPTTRLARYPLLLEAVLKHTPSDSSDKTILPQVISLVRDFLSKVNAESGKTENRFNLLQLDQHLVFKPGEEVNLRLTEEGREMVYKGTLNKRDGEVLVYLFDHALLFAKFVKTKNIEQYKVFRRPIPLELLLVTAPPDENSRDSARPQQRKPQSLVRRSSFEERKNRNVTNMVTMRNDNNKGVHWINFVHLGRKHYNLMLWATTPISQQKWLETIYKQQQIMRERSLIFEALTLSEGFFSGPNKVNCAAPYSGGRRVVYGTDDGVYLSDLRESKQEPVRVLALLDVLQVDVLEDYQLLIVLSERQVITFPLDALDPLDPMAGLKRAKRISSHTSFFKAGFCLGRVLVCIVKSSQLSSTFKTLEPIDQNVRGRAKPTFKKLLQGGNDTLKLFREFYIPVESTSIHYLKTKLCVGCSRGFEIVDLESLDTQGLLDPNDESLEFVRKRENLRPMAIYRLHNEFLLCYDEFAFYVNKNGRRSRKDFMVHWEGMPTGFALHEPYVLAFEPSFVEIRHIETGFMTQVIQGTNMRLLFADTPPSVNNANMHPYPQQNAIGYGYNPYAPHHYAEQYPRHPQGVGREEILIVSDDRVLALRPVHRGISHPQRHAGDNVSIPSVARPQRYAADNMSVVRP